MLKSNNHKPVVVQTERSTRPMAIWKKMKFPLGVKKIFVPLPQIEIASRPGFPFYKAVSTVPFFCIQNAVG